MKEQFGLWLYLYIFKEALNQFSQIRLKQIRVTKEIAYKIIDFIAQFEDELVRIWNKPKFVLNANYVISIGELNRHNPKIISEILESNGFTERMNGENWAI